MRQIVALTRQWQRRKLLKRTGAGKQLRDERQGLLAFVDCPFRGFKLEVARPSKLARLSNLEKRRKRACPGVMVGRRYSRAVDGSSSYLSNLFGR